MKMGKIKTSIILKTMNFYAFHGVLPQERIVGGDYEVNIKIGVDRTLPAIMADAFEYTVNYADIYHLVENEMRKSSNLLEHVAGRIINKLFINYHQVLSAEVRVKKVSPPISSSSMSAEVCLNASNPWCDSVELLVLDFDGTLANTSSGIVNTMLATFKEHANSLLPGVEDIKQTIGLPLYDGIARLLPPQTTDDLISEYVETYRRLFENIGAYSTCVYPHVISTLKAIKQKAPGVVIAVATSRGHKSVVELCNKIGLNSYVDYYIAEDDVLNKKPHPEAVIKLMQMTHIDSSKVLVVGDTVFDIEMGKKAGCRTCGVTYGNHSCLQLALAEASVLIDDFGDVANIVL